MKKIAILLPLKERYRKFDAGSVSLFVHSHLQNSVFKKKLKYMVSTLTNHGIIKIMSN